MTILWVGMLHLATGLAVALFSLRFDARARKTFDGIRAQNALAGNIAVFLAAFLWPLVVIDYARRGFWRLRDRVFPCSSVYARSELAPPKCKFCVDIGRVRVEHDPRHGTLYQPDFAAAGEMPGYLDPRPSLPCPKCQAVSPPPADTAAK